MPFYFFILLSNFLIRYYSEAETDLNKYESQYSREELGRIYVKLVETGEEIR
jgi:hypothetical protein